MPPLCGTLVVVATGSIGVIAAGQFVLVLRHTRQVSGIRMVMSSAATKFVTPLAMQAFSGQPVVTDLFAADSPYLVGHLQISEGADVMLVMPATANILGKAAAGIADDAASTAIISAACPVIFIPSMNERMWSNAVVQRNVATLRSLGHRVIEPEMGIEVATLELSRGSMASFDSIMQSIAEAVRQPPRASGDVVNVVEHA